MPPKRGYKVVKRAMDIVISLIALLLLSPVLVILTVVIVLRLGTPVLFSQTRPGYRSRLFKIMKFRSMTSATDRYGILLPDENRLPPFGKWLRATSLDELPSLVNVLRGDISLVGPRPLLPEYLPLYSAEQSRRHDVKPGLTGWAQVMGRNSLSWEEKFEYDLWYVDNQSLALDVKIIMRTVLKVARKQDVNSDGHVTMPSFKGSDNC